MWAPVGFPMSTPSSFPEAPACTCVMAVTRASQHPALAERHVFLCWWPPQGYCSIKHNFVCLLQLLCVFFSFFDNILTSICGVLKAPAQNPGSSRNSAANHQVEILTVHVAGGEIFVFFFVLYSLSAYSKIHLCTLCNCG